MSTAAEDTALTPTLDDCANEPIHIPGAIQPQGGLLVLEDGAVAAYSANLPALLGMALSVGQRWPLAEPRPLLEGLEQEIESARETAAAVSSVQQDAQGARFSRVTHTHDGRTLVEWEDLGDLAAPLLSAGAVFAATKASSTTQQLLQTCCEEIRRWTGFDRVMGYVFQPDLSGEVAAESRSERIDSFLYMRFPASDIPAQARALYVRNTLRFIADVNYDAVPLVARAGDRPVDLSGAVLRSVSPIHIEYLRNMGVQASMSVSIVVDNQLWGMFACHHNEPLQLPLATREACDMVAHFASARVQMLQAADVAARHAQSAALISELGGNFMRAEDPVRYLQSIGNQLRTILRVEGLVIAHRGKVITSGDIPRDAGWRVAQFLAARDPALPPIERREDWPEDVQARLGEWVGALDIPFDSANGGRIVAMRREQVSNVRWAGRPEKVFGEGPRGPRLSPRGSFTEWRETVRGRSAPWLQVTREIARSICIELSRAAGARQQELDDARRHLLAMLGHDLRDPLHTIRMAASALQYSEQQRSIDTGRSLASRIDTSSGRMQRLITQVLDFSRAEAGMPLLGELSYVDLATLVDDLVEESRLGHPETRIETAIQRPLMTSIDSTRIAQAYANLISNARHHADVDTVVHVSLDEVEGVARFVVTNQADPIPHEVVRVLFDPLKRIERSPANRSGLGLGLYIAYRIAMSLGGDLSYGYDAGRVVFTLTTPVQREGARR